MLRYVLILLIVLIMLPVLRGWLGALARLLMNWALGPGASSAAKQRSPMAPPPAQAGSTMLHKDPVCGAYVSEAVAVTLKDNGQTMWFCSEACRDKYRRRA
jgi:YHS domain-containing protein